VSRRTITPLVDAGCDAIIEEGHKKVLEIAMRYGCTQLSDGRSNIVNDPLLVMGVQAAAVFFPLGAHNAGVSKKHAAYLANVSREYLTRFPELSAETFGSVSDGAQSCLNALDLTAESEFLVPVRCQSHAMSLLLKGIAKGPFQDTVEKAGSLINWIRGRPRIHALVKDVSGKAVFRFVEVRFATHVIACNRLLVLRPNLFGLVLASDGYAAYKSDQNARDRAEFEKYETLIQNQAFWNDVKNFCQIAVPATVALRLLDCSHIRTKDVNTIWTSLGKRLAEVLLTTPVSWECKKEVFDCFKRVRLNAHRPIFDAAWVLDPVNLTKVRAWANHTDTDAERAEWIRMKKNTLDILGMMQRRKLYVNAQKSEREKQKRARMSSENTDVQSRSSIEVEVDRDALEVEYQSSFDSLTAEFTDYYAGRREFGGGLVLRTVDDWIASDGRLKYFAIRATHMACTISNIERLHKAYAFIHTPERNMLLDPRVDRLTLARIICRMNEKSAFDESVWRVKYEIGSIETFSLLPNNVEESFASFHHILDTALELTRRSIQSPTMSGQITLEGGAEIIEETITTTAISAEDDPDLSTDMTEMEEHLGHLLPTELLSMSDSGL
jgi:hypothetical protein